jgi:hypothetical protein
LTAETAIVKADLLEMHTLSDVQQTTLNKLQLLLEQIDSNANANGMLALLSNHVLLIACVLAMFSRKCE